MMAIKSVAAYVLYFTIHVMIILVEFFVYISYATYFNMIYWKNFKYSCLLS